MRAEVLLDSPLSSVALCDEAVITMVTTELTLEALRVSEAAYHRVCALYPGTIGITLVHAGIKLPNAELRAASSESMARCRGKTRCVARVFFGDGFMLSSVRSVLTAIELIRPYDLPRRTFGELAPATDWVAQQVQRDAGWAAALLAELSVFAFGSSAGDARSLPTPS